MARKCGSCQKNKNGEQRPAARSISPRAAVQPINGGNAPGIAPTMVFSHVTRLSGV